MSLVTTKATKLSRFMSYITYNQLNYAYAIKFSNTCMQTT